MSAIISECGLYRYELERDLPRPAGAGALLRPCTFIMLNPSTADAELDDPTIRRCKSFAVSFECDRLVVVNLFAFRATKPVDLYKAADPVGPDNDRHIGNAMQDARVGSGPIVCAWGANETRARDFQIKRMAESHGLQLYCLDRTKGGAPKHPLYIAGGATLKEWR